MKPRTPAQQAASRANGAKSRGPITPRGKHHSALNSTRHGLLCQTVVLPEESKHRFMTIVRDLFTEHNPQTPTETLLVEGMAVAQWKLFRIWGAQSTQLATSMAAAQQVNPAETTATRTTRALNESPQALCSPALLARYEAQADRQLKSGLIRLERLRRERKTLERLRRERKTMERPKREPETMDRLRSERQETNPPITHISPPITPTLPPITHISPEKAAS